MAEDWGYAVVDGQRVPLAPPAFTVPEDEREYIYHSPGLTLWTRKMDQ